MRCARPATIPGCSRSGIIKPAPGKRITASASIIFCCQPLPQTGSALPGSIVTSAPGRSRPTTFRCGSIWRARRNSQSFRPRLIPPAFEPIFQINERECAFVVAGALERAIIYRLDPWFVGAGAVASEREPHQTACGLARHDLSLEQEITKRNFGATMGLGRGKL